MEPRPWPLYDIVVRTPVLEWRLPTEAEYEGLIAHMTPAIYERTGFLPFQRDWTSDPDSSWKFFYQARAEWTPDSWLFPAAAFVEGEPVGVQSIQASDFGILKAVHSGSWLAAHAQGQGLGTELRHAALHFAFAGLGALEAHSVAHVDNHASNAVSAKLGYEVVGRWGSRFGEARHDAHKLILRRSTWQRYRRDDIEIVGFEQHGRWFGL